MDMKFLMLINIGSDRPIMLLFLFINICMPTVFGMGSYANNCWHGIFNIYEQDKIHAQLS